MQEIISVQTCSINLKRLIKLPISKQLNKYSIWHQPRHLSMVSTVQIESNVEWIYWLFILRNISKSLRMYQFWWVHDALVTIVWFGFNILYFLQSMFELCIFFNSLWPLYKPSSRLSSPHDMFSDLLIVV